jgi:hypothetical protein
MPTLLLPLLLLLLLLLLLAVMSSRWRWSGRRRVHREGRAHHR